MAVLSDVPEVSVTPELEGELVVLVDVTPDSFVSNVS